MAVGPRRQGRERALGLLYEAEMKEQHPLDLLAELPVPPEPFARELVEGVARSSRRIDELIVRNAVDWKLDRMPPVDRSILRLAVHELLDRERTPVAAVIDEAVSLANEFASEQSGRFVNGVLGAIATQVRDRR